MREVRRVMVEKKRKSRRERQRESICASMSFHYPTSRTTVFGGIKMRVIVREVAVREDASHSDVDIS